MQPQHHVLPPDIAKLLLIPCPRAFGLARSAFGVLAAPRAHAAALNRLYGAASGGCSRALREQCVYVTGVGSFKWEGSERIHAAHCTTAAASAHERGYRVCLVEDNPNAEFADISAAFAELRGRGARALPVVDATFPTDESDRFVARVRGAPAELQSELVDQVCCRMAALGEAGLQAARWMRQVLGQQSLRLMYISETAPDVVLTP